ncbi:MAG: NAD(P)/FAD-dependent oxidoreductase [Nocardioides sp.]|nr:NAD(P)/FAD-dependent oxidoreductase [Nocardioides sp.]
MRIAVVGLGMGGATLACLLADRGLDVTVVEQAEDPRPVGAGIWLQAMGQQVLDRLDLLAPLAAVSRQVSHVRIENASGRVLVDLGYDAVPGATPALGVHRGALFSLLHDAVRARGVPIHLGVPVTGVRPTAGGLTLETAHGDHSSYDLVVGCDGSRSRVRRSMDVTVRDRVYEYGALWAIVDDPDELAGHCLYQCLRGTRDYLGVLPTGQDRSSVFWSARQRDMAGVLARGLDAWREEARVLAGDFAPLLDSVAELLPATYRDVVVRTPYRLDGVRGAVLVGDAAHAMSPQLGTGTSLALADAWTLDHALAAHSDLSRALAAYAQERRRHVRWYQWWTRLMMPVFQSDLTPLAWPRDLLAPGVMRVPGVAGLMVDTLLGDRTSPWSAWNLP